MKPYYKAWSLSLISFVMLLVVPLTTLGAGVAAIKEQSFHADAGANIVIFDKLTDNGGPFIKLSAKNKDYQIERSKLAGLVEVLSVLPENITTDSEMQPLRNSLKQVQEFSKRFPKSESVLDKQVTDLNAIIKGFEGGQVRYNGQWIKKEKWAAISHGKEEQLAEAQRTQDRITKEKESLRAERFAREKRIRVEKEKFAKSQREKGLVEYEGKWLPKDVVQLIVETEEAHRNKAGMANQATSEANAKGIRTTINGYLASPSMDLLDKAIGYQVDNDAAAFRTIMAGGLVIQLKGGLPCEIVDTKIFQGLVKIRIRGTMIEVWTVTEAITHDP